LEKALGRKVNTFPNEQRSVVKGLKV